MPLNSGVINPFFKLPFSYCKFGVYRCFSTSMLAKMGCTSTGVTPPATTAANPSGSAIVEAGRRPHSLIEGSQAFLPAASMAWARLSSSANPGVFLNAVTALLEWSLAFPKWTERNTMPNSFQGDSVITVPIYINSWITHLSVDN